MKGIEIILKTYLKKSIIGIVEYFQILKNNIKNKIVFTKNIKKYKNFKKIPNKRVIYTCIVGDYDKLNYLEYIDNTWDYICFTDNSKIISDGVWQIKPLKFEKLDASRNNRWHKINADKILENYDVSLYLDGNIRIKSMKFYELLEKNKHEIFISTLHPKRTCLYEEAKICKKLKLEKNEIIDQQMEIIKKNGFSQNYGLYEANIIYRYHNNDKIKKLNREWWYFIENFAKRDQLSLTYCCWKHDIPFKTFLGYSFRKKNKYITILPHTKK